MTLFELLVVMTIIGIVYSVALFSLNKEKALSSSITLETLRSSLSALRSSEPLRLVCLREKNECSVYDRSDKTIALFRLQSPGIVERYGFNRYGELKPWGTTLAQTGGKLNPVRFEYVLYPDGTSTPLILKSKNRFYAYTPLGDAKPLVTESEEELRLLLYGDHKLPLRADGYYGAP